MEAFIFRSHVREDGGVEIRLPRKYAGTDVELAVVVHRLYPSGPSDQERSSGSPDQPEGSLPIG